jgi:hypothetical protein
MAPPAQVTISIATISQPIPNAPLPDAKWPTITIDGVEVPPPTKQPTPYPSGFQIVVLNSAGDLSQMTNIVANAILPIWPDGNNGWIGTYRFMYDDLANTILGAGDPQQQIVLAASFGMDLAMIPTPVAAEQLMAVGAGPQLQQWLNADTPSEGGEWTEYCTNYAMIGNSGSGYGQATEQFDFGGDNVQVETTISVTLQNNQPPPTEPPPPPVPDPQPEPPVQAEPPASY